MVPTLFIVTGYVANKALLEDIGWDPENPPHTWDELREAGALAVAKDIYLCTMNTIATDDLYPLIWQADGRVLSDDLAECLFDTEPVIEAVGFEVEAFRNGWVPLEGAVGSLEESSSMAAVNYFFNKQQIMTRGNPNIIDQVARQAPDMELVLVPVWEYKKQIHPVSAGCWGIFKPGKQLEAAVEWIRFMIEPENQGFYCSVTAFVPPRNSAEKYWTVSGRIKEFVATNLPHAGLGPDLNYYRSIVRLTMAPHLQAAALDLKTVEQACLDADAEIDEAIAEEIANLESS
jgi:multiple sugar transport system substrate-binding protein